MGAIHSCGGLGLSLKVRCPDLWEIIRPEQNILTISQFRGSLPWPEKAGGFRGNAEYRRIWGVDAAGPAAREHFLTFFCRFRYFHGRL